MTRLLESIEEVVDAFDVAVLDQFGVLLAGATAYPAAAGAIAMLAHHGKAIAVLSNSGKRAAVNRDRLAGVGLPTSCIAHVVTSGEALWQDLADGRLAIGVGPVARLLPICARTEDASMWAAGNDRVTMVAGDPSEADAILAMGTPDGIAADHFDELLDAAHEAGLTLICSNPDRQSPRGDRMVLSPGAIAARYDALGGRVLWYGKPYPPVFAAVRRLYPEVPVERFLMVGDSLEHDIVGGANAGFSTLLVRGGVHADSFADATSDMARRATIAALASAHHAPAAPTYSLRAFL